MPGRTRRPVRAATALMVAAALVTSACGGSEADAETAESTTSTTPTTTTVAPTTTLAPTEAPTTTTTEVVDLGPLYPLTGTPIGDSDDPTHPAVVMKISNNDGRSRAAMIGLDRADIVFEERIEANATRFAAVFHSEIPEEIGPVRSARTSDVDIVANLTNPIFGYSGSNQGVAAELRQAEREGLLTRVTAETGASPFYRNTSFSAPDNMMVAGPDMVDQAPEGATPPTPIFDYSNNVVELGVPSAGVTVSARSTAAYVWSEADGGYLRYQDGTPFVTRDDAHVTTANVIILTTTYLPSRIDASSVDAQTIGSGPVVVYANGFRVEGTWTRDFRAAPYVFTTPDGQEIGLAPGSTWVSLTPGGTATELSSQQAAALR